jgi:hypothetical protein
MIGAIFGLRPPCCVMAKKWQKRVLGALKAVIGNTPRKSLFGR